jgi:D-aminoacyl-tRNA deacylase
MRIILVSSKSDPAGRNIRGHILEQLPSISRRDVTFVPEEVEGRLIAQDRIDERLRADLIIFLSRHTSTRPAPLLSVHVTGNPSHAELGGVSRSFPPAAPLWMRSVLLSLIARAPPGYRVTYEVTHHGPTELTTPSFFVEIGSTLSEWEDPRAGRCVAESVLTARPEPALRLVGLGGNHYATRATAIIQESRAAFGHIIPSREVSALDLTLMQRLAEQSVADAAYMDRKALPASEVQRLEALLKQIALPLLSEHEIQEMADLPWNVYTALRRIAESELPTSQVVIDGLTGEGIPVSVRLDPELLSEALHADRHAVLEGLRDMPLAHLRGPDGALLPVFITFEGNQSSVINHLIRLCVKIIVGNQKTSLDGDSLIIHGMRFDPQKARALGIPSGPLYGLLSAGHTIELDGRMITPEMVQTETKRTLHIPGLGRYV